MTINIIAPSNKGIVAVTDGYSRFSNARPSGTVKKLFETNPSTITTIAGQNGFISRKRVKEEGHDVYPDLTFKDLHKAVESDEASSPIETSRRLRRNAKSLVHFSATTTKRNQASIDSGRNFKGLLALMTGYDDNNQGQLVELSLPTGKEHKAYTLPNNQLVITGTGLMSTYRTVYVLNTPKLRSKLLKLIDRKIKDEDQKLGFLRLIKRYSKKHGFNALFDLSLKGQEKYFRRLAELTIFIDANSHEFSESHSKLTKTSGGLIQSSTIAAR